MLSLQDYRPNKSCSRYWKRLQFSLLEIRGKYERRRILSETWLRLKDFDYHWTNWLEIKINWLNWKNGAKNCDIELTLSKLSQLS